VGSGKKVQIEVGFSERKAAVLAPSTLECLSGLPTINLTSGCAHQCLYCYSRGYSQFPGENKVVLYANTFDKLQVELPRKRRKPVAVYFSPSTDAFQPVGKVLELSYRCMKFLLEHGVGVAVLTKGRIPERHMRLFAAHSSLVQVQIDVTTLDEETAAIFEPNAAPPRVRIRQMARLVEAGVTTRARLDPILPGITDGEPQLAALVERIAETGVREAAIATLFLRTMITASLKRNLSSRPDFFARLMREFEDGTPLALHAQKSRVISLSVAKRKRIYSFIRKAAARHGISVRVCACKNGDMPSRSCNIAGKWVEPEAPAQALLFDRS
jgi:DNA repair photolyase